MSFSRSRVVLALAVAVFGAQAPLLGAPGFGTLRKKVIQLQVRRPAVVRLANTSIAFRGKVANPEYAPVLASLEATLETQLVSNERTLVKKPVDAAEWVLELTVTGFSIPPSKQTTSGSGNTAVTNVIWSGSLTVAYQVLDKKGTVHDADNVRSAYDREFPASGQSGNSRFGIPGLGSATKPGEVVPHSADDVKQILLQQLVAQISSNLGNTVQGVEARLAGGETHLDRAATFMEQKLWARSIEELEKTPAFTKPDDESFRQYQFALAYEGVSYSSEKYEEQRNNLFKAQEYYDKALELNPGEKYFVEVVARTKESVARYRKLDAMKKEDQLKTKEDQVKAPPGGGGPTVQLAANPGAAKPARKPLTLNDVVELFTAPVPQDTIVEMIRESPADYDLLSKDAVLAIAKVKLPIAIQNEMRKKVGMTAIPEPAAAPKAPVQPKAAPPSAPAPAPKPATSQQPAGKKVP
jgi:tetratricopeptide (TPR) repeat protein